MTGLLVIMGSGDFQVFVSTEANSGNGFESGGAQGVALEHGGGPRRASRGGAPRVGAT